MNTENIMTLTERQWLPKDEIDLMNLKIPFGGYETRAPGTLVKRPDITNKTMGQTEAIGAGK